MCIYNKSDLQNIFITKQSAHAFAEGYINLQQFEDIKSKHTTTIYSPNIFVAVGLGLLTILIVLAAGGLGALLFGPFFRSGTLFLLFGVLCYVALEFMCDKKKHKDSGVDIVLMAIVALGMAGGFDLFFIPQLENLFLSLLLLLIFTWFTYRFVNLLSGVAAHISLFVFVFNSYTALGEFTIFSFPFVLIGLSILTYYFAVKNSRHISYFMYYPIFRAIKMVSIFAFYGAGNYYLLDSIINTNYLLTAHSALSFGWFFWMWTFAVPVVYLLIGIKRKDILFIRTGALFIALSIVTFKYYHHIIPIDVALLIAGVILVPLSYILMRFLKDGKYGFIYNAEVSSSSKRANLEAFALSQLAIAPHASEDTTKFGGGSFGGAGSGSNY